MVLPCGVCIYFKYRANALKWGREFGRWEHVRSQRDFTFSSLYLLFAFMNSYSVNRSCAVAHWQTTLVLRNGLVWFANALKLIFWKWLICFFLMHGSLFDFQAFHTFAFCTETKDNVWMPLQSKCIHSLFGSSCWAVGIIMHSRFHFGWLLFP